MGIFQMKTHTFKERLFSNVTVSLTLKLPNYERIIHYSSAIISKFFVAEKNLLKRHFVKTDILKNSTNQKKTSQNKRNCYYFCQSIQRKFLLYEICAVKALFFKRHLFFLKRDLGFCLDLFLKNNFTSV